jgi:hypothetical protein
MRAAQYSLSENSQEGWKEPKHNVILYRLLDGYLWHNGRFDWSRTGKYMLSQGNFNSSPSPLVGKTLKTAYFRIG